MENRKVEPITFEEIQEALSSEDSEEPCSLTQMLFADEETFQVLMKNPLNRWRAGMYSSYLKLKKDFPEQADRLFENKRALPPGAKPDPTGTFDYIIDGRGRDFRTEGTK